MRARQVLGVLIILAVVAAPLVAGETDAGPKRALAHSDYDGWKTIRQSQISDDGQWFLYRETPGEGDSELVVKNIDSDAEYRHAIGYSAPTRGRGRFGGQAPRPTDVVFSADNRFVVFLINPTFEETQKSRNQRRGGGAAARGGSGRGGDRNQPVKSLGIMNLSNGDVELIERVKSFQLAEKSPDWLVYLKEEPKPEPSEGSEGRAGRGRGNRERPSESEDSDDDSRKDKKYGTALAIRTITGGTERSIQSVLEYKLTKNADWLLYTVSDKEAPASDGVYAARPGSSGSHTVLSGEGNYKKWTFDEEETRLAFLSDRDSYDQKQPILKLYGWDLGSGEANLWVAHDHTSQFPQGMVVSDKEDVRFSPDGKWVLFGIADAPEPEVEGEDDDNTPKKVEFDLWHWNDPYPTPQQKLLSNRYKNETYDSIYNVDLGTFRQLADDGVPDVEFAKQSSLLFASTEIPYRKLISWDSTYSDAYLIDPKTGERVQAAEKVSRPQLSPTGRFVYWFDGKDWWVFDGKSRQQRNLTQGLDVSFAREDWDTPSTPRAYGVAGWTDGDAALLAYDHYDIWALSPDGTAPRTITEGQGRENGLSFRWMDLDPDNDFVAASGSLLLQATNTDTMSTGFYRDTVSGTTPPSRLNWADAAWGRPTKARSADRMIVTKQSFSEYPDLWATNMELSAPKKVTDLGAQMAPFLWGKAELVDFQSADGKPLKGILVKPENFDPSRQYPLMVYIYETLHDGVHRYRHPGPGTSINFSYYSSNDYVLWMPDIEYDTGYPGKDALKCVLPGIQMLVRDGYINEDAIGIQGHSWGGYQIAYMVTQTNIFKAAEAGAPVSNMTSAYGGIRWGSGMVRQFQYERTQSRLGDTLWNVPTRYINNSPVFFADRIETPLLILHNDEDGAVPWYQGIELIMAMRRLGREGYMFNYNGEEHGLRQRDNQKHFTERMAEFFDHLLKGAPLPEWMEEGRMAWEKP